MNVSTITCWWSRPAPKLVIRDNYGFLQEIKVKDIDRTPKLPKVEPISLTNF
jgi:hypothetical protein